ncbi:MAG: hypothetical protein IJU72_05090 [Bacteroidales bacterium]|nr:hypothetical protein [Bacteroidales bacterium]
MLATLFSIGLQAQISDRTMAGDARAMGAAHTAMTSQWAALSNQAALGWDSTLWVGALYENRYMLKQLGVSLVGGVLPVRPGAFGISLSHMGYSQMGLSRADLSYGMRLGPHLSAGIGFGLHYARFTGEHKSRFALTVSAGIQYRPVRQLLVGAHLFNPARASLDERQTMPPALAIGLAFMPHHEFTITLQADASTETRTALRGGMEYRPISALALRMGYASGSPEGLTAGVGLAIKRIALDAGVAYHRVLGITSSVAVSYSFE